MIKNSLFDYITIRISITTLRLIAPLSIVYVPCGFLNLFALPWIYNVPLALYTTAEAAFYVFVYLPRRRKLQEPPVHRPPSLTRAQRQRIFDKCIEADNLHLSLGQKQGRPYPTGWFLPADSTPTRNDAIDWLLWALFSTSREAGTVDLEEESMKEELDGYIERIEKAIGRTLEEDALDEGEVYVHRLPRVDEETGRHRESQRRKDGVRSMRITLDPVQMLHRPLLWYSIVCLVDTYTTIFFLFLGFNHYVPRTREHRVCFPPRPILHFVSKYAPPGVVIPYWHRPHQSKTKMPVVFLHGIGIGLYPYIPFIRKIIPSDSLTDGDVGVLLPELLPISMHMTPLSVPPCAEMLRSLDLILEHLQASDTESTRDIQHTRLRDDETTDRNDERRPLLRASSMSSFSSTSSIGASLPSYATITPSHSQQSLFLDSPPDPNPIVTSNPVPESDTGWDRVALVAHSYGTFVAGWVMRMCVDADVIAHDDIPVCASPSNTASTSSPALEPKGLPHSLAHKIAHMVLVDPIPILLSDPTVAHNFLYREPGTVCPIMLGSVGEVVEAESVGISAVIEGELLGQSAHGVNVLPAAFNNSTTDFTADTKAPKHTSFSRYYSSAAAWQLWYFASRDADVARTLCRAFFWAEGGVWREEVGRFVCCAGTIERSCAGANPSLAEPDLDPRLRSQTASIPDQSEAGRGTPHGRNMAVFLGGMDQIVPAEAIRRHLTRERRCTRRWSAKGCDLDSGDYGDTDTSARAGGVVEPRVEQQEEEEEEVRRALDDSDGVVESSSSSISAGKVRAAASASDSVYRSGCTDMLEVLFNPVLDHAVIFDDETYTEPLVQVVRRYIGDR